MKVTFEFNMILLKGGTSDEGSANEVVNFERRLKLKVLPPVGTEMALHGIDPYKIVKKIRFEEDYGWHVRLDDECWPPSEESRFRDAIAIGVRYGWAIYPKRKD
jgi:hypothetical protein